MLSFFAGWLTSELPVHHLLWQVVATALFVAAGALDDWPGLVGLGITVVSWCGLVVLVVQASRAGGVVEDALQETLGDDYRADMAPELCDDDDRRAALAAAGAPHPHARSRGREGAPTSTTAAQGRRSQRLDVYRNRAHPERLPGVPLHPRRRMGHRRQAGAGHPAHAPARVARLGLRHGQLRAQPEGDVPRSSARREARASPG